VGLALLLGPCATLVGEITLEALAAGGGVVGGLDLFAQIGRGGTAGERGHASAIVVGVEGDAAAWALLALERAGRVVGQSGGEVGGAERVDRCIAAGYRFDRRGEDAAEGVVGRLGSHAVRIDRAGEVAEDVVALEARD